jgi:hypothetical protein
VTQSASLIISATGGGVAWYTASIDHFPWSRYGEGGVAGNRKWSFLLPRKELIWIVSLFLLCASAVGMAWQSFTSEAPTSEQIVVSAVSTSSLSASKPFTTTA